MKTTDFINTYAKEGVNSGEYNDEAPMIKNDLHTIIRVCTHLDQALGNNENLPTWVIEKVAQTKGMIVNVMDYMISQHEMGKKDQVPGFDTNQAEQMFESMLAEESSAGSTGSSSVAVTMQTLGEKGGFTKSDVHKKITGYSNMVSRGGPIKVKQ